MAELWERPDPPERRDDDLDFFEIETRSGSWQVSTIMARHVEASLDAEPPPAWTTFIDLVGARIRVRTETIHTVAQCTVEQRAWSQARMKRLREERETETDPDD